MDRNQYRHQPQAGQDPLAATAEIVSNAWCELFRKALRMQRDIQREEAEQSEARPPQAEAEK